jgi:opacity protein-like surface antigen
MRFWKSGLVAATLIAAAVTPALAEDAPGGTLVPGPQLAQMPPPMMPLTSWTGFYVGINGAGATGPSNWQYSFLPGPVAGPRVPFNVRGPMFGGGGGYNWQFNPSWVLGAEVDWDAAALDGNNNCPNPIFNCQARISNLGTGRLRLGWTGINRLMFYGTGGVAWADENVRTIGTGAVPTSGTPTNGSSQTDVGWTAGAGLEFVVAPSLTPASSLTMKVEYLHYDLGTNRFNVDNAATQFVRTHETGDMVKLGLNLLFNAPPPPPPPPPPPMAMPPAAPVVFIVFFDWDKSTITPEGMGIIQQAANAYKSGAPVQIQVTGYTDRSGSPGYNQRLSERRANNVAKAMAALGVPREQMMVSGRGENDNRVPTANGVREPQNRRVEIVKP